MILLTSLTFSATPREHNTKQQQSNILDLHMLVNKHLAVPPRTGQLHTRLKLSQLF